MLNIKKIDKINDFLNQNDFSVICVTGKMASGKNHFCSVLQKFGWKTHDADIDVHQAINESSSKIIEVFSEIAKQKKIELLDGNGSLNRKNLGKILFSSKKLLKQQENIVYPLVEQKHFDFLLKNENAKCVLNATVLFKTPSLLEKCDVILFVKSSLIKRVLRAKKRDKLSFIELFKRIYSQRHLFNDYKKTGKKIVVIQN